MSIPFHLGTKLEYRTGLQPVKPVLQTGDSSLCLTVRGAGDRSPTGTGFLPEGFKPSVSCNSNHARKSVGDISNPLSGYPVGLPPRLSQRSGAASLCAGFLPDSLSRGDGQHVSGPIGSIKEALDPPQRQRILLSIIWTKIIVSQFRRLSSE